MKDKKCALCVEAENELYEICEEHEEEADECEVGCECNGVYEATTKAWTRKAKS